MVDGVRPVRSADTLAGALHFLPSCLPLPGDDKRGRWPNAAQAEREAQSLFDSDDMSAVTTGGTRWSPGEEAPGAVIGKSKRTSALLTQAWKNQVLPGGIK